MYELIESQKYSENINNIITNEIENKKLHRDKISKNPKTYNVVTSEDYHKALKSGAYFWRKFPKTIVIPNYIFQML